MGSHTDANQSPRIPWPPHSKPSFPAVPEGAAAGREGVDLGGVGAALQRLLLLAAVPALQLQWPERGNALLTASPAPASKFIIPKCC